MPDDQSDGLLHSCRPAALPFPVLLECAAAFWQLHGSYTPCSSTVNQGELEHLHTWRSWRAHELCALSIAALRRPLLCVGNHFHTCCDHVPQLEGRGRCATSKTAARTLFAGTSDTNICSCAEAGGFQSGAQHQRPLHSHHDEPGAVARRRRRLGRKIFGGLGGIGTGRRQQWQRRQRRRPVGRSDRRGCGKPGHRAAAADHQ